MDDFRHPTPSITDSTKDKNSKGSFFSAKKIQRMKELIRLNNEIEEKFKRKVMQSDDFLRSK